MNISLENTRHHSAVRQLHVEAFPSSVESELVEQLRKDGDGEVSLVALEEDGVVGHVMFSRMSAPFKALGLAPVSVSPHRQRQGIAAQLTLGFNAGGHRLGKCHRHAGLLASQDLLAAEVAAIGDHIETLRPECGLGLRGHGAELGTIVTDIRHLVGHDEMVRGVDRGLYVVTDDARPAPAGRH